MAPRTKTFHHKVASWAFLALPITLAAFLLIAVLVPDDLPEEIVTRLAFEAVFGLLFGLMLRRGRWALGAAVFSLLFTLIGLAAGGDYGIRHPESFFDFTGSLVAFLAPLTAFVATIAAIRGRRKGAEAAPPTARQRRLLIVAGCAAAAVVATSGVLSILHGPTVVRPGEPVAMTTYGDRFEPAEFSVRSGDSVEFVIRNDDGYAHRFSIDEFKLDDYIGPSATARKVGFVVDAPPGVVRLYCSVSGHEGMVGRFIVKPPARS